jgi:hypothetical protein
MAETVTPRRLVAVFGYSRRGMEGLHAICRDRLERGAGEAGPNDAVLLSGWARRRHARSEAELMVCAWPANGTATLLVDHDARTTYGNAMAAASAARRLRVDEVVLVTSGWHARRAATLLRAALRDTGLPVQLAATSDRGSLVARARELLCWPLVPVLAAAAGRKR